MAKQWMNILGVVVIVLGILMNLEWIWGGMFFIWFIQGIQHEETMLFSRVSKAENAAMYWTILALWLVMALYSLSALLYYV